MSVDGTLVIDDVLTPAEVADVLAVIRAGRATPAMVSAGADGYAVSAGVRRTELMTVPAETRAQIVGAIRECIPQLATFFGLELGYSESPQILRYATGNFFVAHQDGNTPSICDSSDARRVSISLFLNEQSEAPREGAFGGGDLVMHGDYRAPYRRDRVEPRPGSLVAFRSEWTHEVTPVTHGERYAVVTWFHGISSGAASTGSA